MLMIIDYARVYIFLFVQIWLYLEENVVFL